MLTWLTGTSEFKTHAKFKQDQRAERIAALPQYAEPLTPREHQILDESVAGVVKLVQAGELSPRDVLSAYAKRALAVQPKINAITEVMIADAEKWAEDVKHGPLTGFPVSIKDPFIVKGYDALAGYASGCHHTFEEDGTMARLLRDAGAVLYVKTNVPSTMMAIEGYNDVWGRTTNAHNQNYAPGGSSQGEGALISAGGSRIGIGTDIGGSVRVPAAWSGIYSLRMTTFRFPMDGDISCDRGFEGVQYVASPMARTLDDLRYFTQSVMGMKPWEYDYHLLPIPWREVSLPKRPRVGVLRLDDLLPLTPAQNRALVAVTEALRRQGNCEIVEFTLPRPAIDYDRTVFRLYQADGMDIPGAPLLKGEHNDPYVEGVMNYIWWPRWVRRTYEGALRFLGYDMRATILGDMDNFSVEEYYAMVRDREALRRGVREKWDELKLDFMVTAPHPSPAVPNGAPNSFYAILFTSLFNLLDYPAGILPVGRVSPKQDAMPASFNRKHYGWQANISFDTYDAQKMEGLPTSVQVVAKRYDDEVVMKAMELIVESLKKDGIVYDGKVSI